MKSSSGCSQKPISALLTEAQAADYLGVSLSTLRRWRKRRAGPTFFLLGGILRYQLADLQEFIVRNLRVQGVA
jgi:transcriptional regulator with XRE-family HTH domain